jgi:hypothetical protein
MSDLDWRTESDEGLEIHVDDTRPAPRRWRRFIVAGFTVAVLALAIVRHLNQRVAGRGLQADADLRAAYQLWRAAVLAADTEVFSAILERGDPSEWAEAQIQLLRAGLAGDPARTLFGSEKMSLPPADQIEVRPSPDGRQAEIDVVQAYRPSESTLPPFKLRQTLFLSQAAGQWLFASPEPDYWGARRRLNGAFLRLEYPARDADLAERFGRDLEAELRALCAATPSGTDCSVGSQIRLRFETDPAVLLDMPEKGGPIIAGREFVWPSPSLLGRPIDDPGYRALYSVMAEPIIRHFAAMLESPIPLPAQRLQVICYPEFGWLPRVFRYDPSADSWADDFPERAFRYQAAAPGDDAVILVEFADPSSFGRLRLAYQAGGRLRTVFDHQFSGLYSYPAGWGGPPDHPRLILHGFKTTLTEARFQWLDLDQCGTDSCRVHDLGGFPYWSPDGRHTLSQQNLQVFLGGGEAGPDALLGRGSSPFWVDADHFGYVTQESQGGRTVVQVVVGRADHAETAVLFDSDAFAEVAGLPAGEPIFFTYLTTSAALPNHLLGTATRYEPSQTRTLVFTARVEENAAGRLQLANLAVRLNLSGGLAGSPSLLAPLGSVPFVVSPDGHSLSLAQLVDSRHATWRLTVHRLDDGQTFSFDTGYPPSNFGHPYYDWSADGRWLALVDDGFLRLIAPGHDYERLILHDFSDCWHAAWVDPPGV